MSDIWIKASTTGTTRWKKAIAIHIKRLSATWSAAKVIWIKNTSVGWLRVWPTSGVFAITDPYITTTASGSTPIYYDGVPIRIGTTYYGRNGTWDANGFTISSFTYTWPYYSDPANQPGDYDLLGNLGTGVYSSPSRALTISTFSDASAVDGKYISFKITANASNALYSNTADSKDTYGKIRVIRRTPINTTFVINGTASVGSTLSIGSAWNTTEAYKPDAARNTVYWYKSSSNTSIYNGQGRTQITSANGSYSYVVQQADLGSYIIAEETAFNTGSDYDIGVGLFTNGLNQVTAVSAIVADTTPQAFNTISYVKNFPSSSAGGVVRTTSLSWNASTNATRYEIEYEGSYNNSTWTTVQSFAASSYTSSTSQSVSWGSPIPSGGFDYYTYMRARVRASNTSTATNVIGDGGSYIYAAGVAPGQPSFGTITYNAAGTTASIPVTVGSAGSNYLYSPPIEYQYRASSGSYSGTWTSSATPISLTGLSPSTTYYIKIRTRNYDELVSPENDTSFATPAAPQYTVTWSANLSGATVSPPSNSGPSGTTVTSPTPTRSGYTFLYWRDGTTVFNYANQINPGGSWTVTYTTTFYAWWSLNPVIPSGGTVSIATNTGNYNVGSVITYSTSGWADTPTSYSLRLYNGTSPVLTSDPLRASTSSASGTYTIVSGDVPNYFKAFATASNSAGTSTEASSTQVGPAVATFVTPSSGPPQISNNQLGFVRSGTSITWYSDYPSVSGDVSYIIGMEWQIRTTNSTTTTPLNTGTYAGGGSGDGLQGNTTKYMTYPVNTPYPYSAAGTVWAFRIRSTENTAATSSARYARARVIMMGTNGTVYFGTWSTNI